MIIKLITRTCFTLLYVYIPICYCTTFFYFLFKNMNNIVQKKKKSVSFSISNNKPIEDDEEQTENEEKLLSFDEMSLDNKILHAIASFGWNQPTLIQEKTIPLALEGI